MVRALNAARLRPQNKGVRICAASGLASQNPRLGLSLAPCFLLLRSGGRHFRAALPPQFSSSPPLCPCHILAASQCAQNGGFETFKALFFLSLNPFLAHAVKYSSQLFRPPAFLFSVRGGGSSGPLQPPHRRPLLLSGPIVHNKRTRSPLLLSGPKVAAQSLTVDYDILLAIENLSRVSENSKEFSPMNGP